MVQFLFTALTSFFYKKCNRLKARVVIYAYNHHVRLLSPEPYGRRQTKVYSGLRSRHCYAIKCPPVSLDSERGCRHAGSMRDKSTSPCWCRCPLEWPKRAQKRHFQALNGGGVGVFTYPHGMGRGFWMSNRSLIRPPHQPHRPQNHRFYWEIWRAREESNLRPSGS